MTLSINPPPGWRTVCGGGRGWLRDVWSLPSHQRDRDVCHQHLQYRQQSLLIASIATTIIITWTWPGRRLFMQRDADSVSILLRSPVTQSCLAVNQVIRVVIVSSGDLKMIIRLWRWSSDHDYRPCLPWGKVRPYGLPGGSDQQDQVQGPRLLQGSCVGCGNNDDGADENIPLIVILMYTVKRSYVTRK